MDCRVKPTAVRLSENGCGFYTRLGSVVSRRCLDSLFSSMTKIDSPTIAGRRWRKWVKKQRFGVHLKYSQPNLIIPRHCLDSAFTTQGRTGHSWVEPGNDESLNPLRHHHVV